MTSPVPQSGNASLGIGEKEIVPTEREIAVFKKLIGDPLFNVSDTKFPSWMVDTVARYGLTVPISQVIGFTGFTPQTAATILTNENRTSSTYGDLATVGPTLTGLPDGQYLLLYGCVAKGIAGSTSAVMSVQVNATAAVDNDAGQNAGSDQVSVMMVTTKSLSSGSNTITAKYRSTDNVNVSSFARRWLIGIKYANS